LFLIEDNAQDGPGTMYSPACAFPMWDGEYRTANTHHPKPYTAEGRAIERSMLVVQCYQLDGTLDRHGRARIGQTRFYFHRDGIATVIGRGESGRYFSVRLLREQIR
jgi:hypothetical protein